MSLTALQASAYLHHLHFHSPDPRRLAEFYEGAMNMQLQQLQDGSLLAFGPERRLLFSEGPAKKLAHAGFAVRDAESLTGLCQRAQEMGLSPRPIVAPMFQDGAFSVTDPDGNAIYFGLAETPAKTFLSPSEERSAIRGPIQHLTLASRDVLALEDFARISDAHEPDVEGIVEHDRQCVEDKRLTAGSYKPTPRHFLA